MWSFPVFNCVSFNFYLLRISGVSNKFSREDHKIRRLFVGKTKLVDVCKSTYVQLLSASFINGNNTTVNFHAINVTIAALGEVRRVETTFNSKH